MARPALKNIEPGPSTAERIVGIATALFLEKGYAATSMNSIAQACGIQKASLYYHYENKEAVVFACLQSGYADHVDQMRAAATNEHLTYADRLKPMIDAVYGAIVESNAGRMSTIMSEMTARFPELAQRFNDEFMEEMQDILRQFVEGGMDAGEFDQMDPMTLDQALFGVPVHLTLCRSMFAGTDLIQKRYEIEDTKNHHMIIMRKLLGISG